METTIIKMSEAYDYQSFYKNLQNTKIIDCTNIEGTKCYLDDSAKSILQEKLKDQSVSGLHFIDSGNYHYLTLLWLQKIDSDFNLVLFDHHPDNQAPSFGDITSCGGWVLEAQQTLPHLKNVYTIGAGNDCSPSEIDTTLPLYISIDKDILSPSDAITDWDQGEMSLPELLSTLDLIITPPIIGIDICGDSSEFASSSALTNNATNLSLLDYFSQKSILFAT